MGRPPDAGLTFEHRALVPAATVRAPTEWRVLDLLVRHPGRLVTQRQLLTEVWGPAYEKGSNDLRLSGPALARRT